MALVSSQGTNFGTVTGARKVTIKKSRASAGASKLDASTLAIAHGGDRIYEDGLPDNGPSGSANGITVTAAVEYLGSGPATGSMATWGGVDLKCIDSENTDEAGALKSGVANFTSDFTEEE